MATRSPSAKRNGAVDPALPQKKRARRRLIGATALCLLAAVILPIVLDSEPRRPRDDIQVRIPSRDTPINDGASAHPPSAPQSADADHAASPQPGSPGAPNGAGADSSSGARRADGSAPKSELAKPEPSTRGATPLAEREAEPGKDPKPQSRAESRVDPKPEVRAERKSDPKPDARAEKKTEARAETKPEARPDPKVDPIAKLAEARAGTGPTRPGTYLLQTGAYASEGAAAEQLERLRGAGVSAYTEKVKTKQGERIRVRAGPFPNRESAEQARARLKSAGIEAAMIAPAEGR